MFEFCKTNTTNNDNNKNTTDTSKYRPQNNTNDFISMRNYWKSEKNEHIYIASITCNKIDINLITLETKEHNFLNIKFNNKYQQLFSFLFSVL